MERNDSTVRIMLVGGGTGGHFYPLIAIAEALNSTPERPRLYYAGPVPYDSAALEKEGITYVSVPAGKKRRYKSVLNIIDLFKTVVGVLIAILKLYSIYPDVIMSKGGYTSVPVVIAGAFLRIPIIVHESDAVMGKANEIARSFARAIIVSYAELATSLAHPHVHTWGIPIRKVFMSNPSPEAIANLGIDPNRPLILVLGGSQGAERINELILDSLDELLQEYSIVHQTGPSQLELCTLSANSLIPDTERRQHYHPLAFLEASLLNDAYHMAQLVISRGGSNSIYEIALHAKPAIIIPIPETISHDQRTNAYSYARTGAAIVLEEENMSDNLLQAEIERIMQSDSVYQNMVQSAKTFARNDASVQISALLLDTAKQH